MEGNRNSCCANFLQAFHGNFCHWRLPHEKWNSWLPYSSLKNFKIAKIAATHLYVHHIVYDTNDTTHTRHKDWNNDVVAITCTTIRRDYPSHWPCIAHHFKIQHNRSDTCWYLGACLIAFNSYHWQEVVDRWADSESQRNQRWWYIEICCPDWKPSSVSEASNLNHLIKVTFTTVRTAL